MRQKNSLTFVLSSAFQANIAALQGLLKLSIFGSVFRIRIRILTIKMRGKRLGGNYKIYHLVHNFLHLLIVLMVFFIREFKK